MPHCDCGFDFAKAHIKKRRLVAYALIPDKSYRAAIRREYAIISEKNAEREQRMIARASSLIGSLMQCPRCGLWLLHEPKRRTGLVTLRKAENSANKMVQRTGASRSARKTNQTSSAAGSRL